jgi:hypothetical protein
MILNLEPVILEERLKLLKLIALAFVTPRIGFAYLPGRHRNRQHEFSARRKHSANLTNPGSIIRQMLEHLQ